MANAAAAPSELDDPRRYVKRAGVAVFDAHTERDGEGDVVRRFSRADLEEIARNGNARALRGSPCPLTLGHTDPDEQDERKQPEIVGYAKNYRVAHSAALNRWVLTADFFIRKDRHREASGFPRVSVELWPGKGDRFLDPIALLRRTPRRDLGQWCYARSQAGAAVLRYSMHANQKGAAVADEFDDLGDEAPLDDAPVDGVDDAPMDDAPPPPTDAERAEQWAKHCFSHEHAQHFAKHYAMPAPGADGLPPVDGPPPAHTPDMPPDAREEPENYSAMPGATNGAIPVAEEPDAYAKARKARNLAKAKEAVSALKAEHYSFDSVRMVERLARLTPAERKAEVAHIRENYARAPVGGAPIPVKAGGAGKKRRHMSEMTPAEFEKAQRYMKHREGQGKPVTFEKAAEKVMGE